MNKDVAVRNWLDSQLYHLEQAYVNSRLYIEGEDTEISCVESCCLFSSVDKTFKTLHMGSSVKEIAEILGLELNYEKRDCEAFPFSIYCMYKGVKLYGIATKGEVQTLWENIE